MIPNVDKADLVNSVYLLTAVDVSEVKASPHDLKMEIVRQAIIGLTKDGKKYAANLEKVPISVIIKECYKYLIDSDQIDSLDNKLVLDIFQNEMDNLKNYSWDNDEDQRFAETLLMILLRFLIASLGN